MLTIPATELASLLERGDISAVGLLDAFLEHYERINPRLNAIVSLDLDAARRAAHASDERARRGARLSALDGVPVTIKDNLFVGGLRATWGSRLYENFVPPCDDIAVERLRSAGALIVGKTNTPEFALASFTDNLLFGPTRNPWNLDCTPGGSSGGAAAAVAAGLGPLAVGTDAGGSIRRPASYTGVVGFRPSTGRIARAFGFPPLAHDFQVIAPLARTVDDVYLLFRTLAGPDRRDMSSRIFTDYPLPNSLDYSLFPRLRIRVVRGIGDAPVAAEVSAHVAAAAKALAQAGHNVEYGEAPFELDDIERIWATFSAAGLARVVLEHDRWAEHVHASSRAIAERGLGISGPEYVRAMDCLGKLRRQLRTFFATTDVLLTPTSPAVAWAVGETHPSHIDARPAGPRAAAVFATFVNAGGLPAISVPVEPAANGLPIGMQLVGGVGRDVQLLRLAKEHEDLTPWASRWPAIATAAKRETSTVRIR